MLDFKKKKDETGEREREREQLPLLGCPDPTAKRDPGGQPPKVNCGVQDRCKHK